MSSILSRKIEDLFSAVSFAEQGEFESAKEMLKEKQKRVLLVMNDSGMSSKTLNYALNTCRRIKADLDIITSTETAGLRRFCEGLIRQGIECKVTVTEGCLKQAVVDYTEAERDILFVVIQSDDVMNTGCHSKTKRLADTWQMLRCPLVVVSARVEA